MQIRYRYIHFFFLLLIGLFTSCEQSIYIKPTDVSDKVNIYSVSNAADTIEVFIYKQKNLAGYLEQTDKIEFIKEATVEVEDLTNGEKQTLTVTSRWDKGDKSYPWIQEKDSILLTYYKGTKRLVANHTYKLTIKNGERIFTSQATVPSQPAVNKVDTTTTSSQFGQIIQEVKIRYQVNDLTLYYEPFQIIPSRYIADVNDTTYYYQTNKPTLTKTESLGEQTTTINNYYFSNDINQPKDTLIQKIAVNVYSEGAGKYLVSTDNQTNTIGNNFSEPSFLKSNIEGKSVSGVFGFFSTSDTVYQKVLGYW